MNELIDLMFCANCDSNLLSKAKDKRYRKPYHITDIGKSFCNHDCYFEFSERSDNKDCAVTQSEIATPKSDKSDFAQS